MSEMVLESPLAGITRLGQRLLQVDGQSCTLGEIPFVEMLNVRGDARDAGFVQALLAATGLHLPVAPNTASLGEQRQLLWMGPDEWLLKLQDGQGAAVEAALRQGLQGRHHSLVQVGDGNTTLTVQGAAAADLLSRGCPLDLHPRAFGSGALAQTHVAKAGAMVLCRAAGTHFELTVRRSFADYLYRWLCEAGD
ncbi:MAG: sarcosine oxidase subunit gamma family protein [Rhodoferax sp.]|nr:sarcosine oxidase subunit gamma family protein [Rhodoferax sp.]MDP3655233.1 sarcosine oxidase subunit gamma family protein [Rhodoferax sp.]